MEPFYRTAFAQFIADRFRNQDSWGFSLIYLSFNDFLHILKRGALLILLGGIVMGCCGLIYMIFRPLHYTAEGIFKGYAPQSQHQFLKALEFLGMEDSYNPSEDPRSFLRSYPVIERVIKELHLQATLIEPKRFFRLWEIWNVLKTAKAYHTLKQERPCSAILRKNILVPQKLIIDDPHSSFFLSKLQYHSETASQLSIRFLSPDIFEVKEKSRHIGKGALEVPFVWERGTFTLSGTGKAKKKIELHLIPLPHAIESLQKSLTITSDLENSSLFHIQFAHRDRHLATQIVNSVMEQFQNYLAEEGKRKISKQIVYLHQRQDETLQQLEAVFEKQKTYLESHLDKGMIPSLEKELDLLADTQMQKRKTLLELQFEMEHLYPKACFQSILEIYRSKKTNSSLLSIDAARDMVRNHQKELHALCLDAERYEDCMAKLSEPSFDGSSLAKTLSEPSLNSHFERMHSLHHQLIDERNWSAKEREQLKTELEIEKLFMRKHAELLKEGVLLHMDALKKRIAALQDDLIFLLVERYQQEEQSLESLALQVKNLPEKWMNEQKIAFTMQLYKEIMESITKMIEAKNLGYHLDDLLSQTVKPAIPPVLPHPPHLLLGTVIGFFAGSVAVILVFLCIAVWKGPSASFEHLQRVGKKVIPLKDTVPLLSLAFGERDRVILLTAKYEIHFTEELAEWLKRKEEATYVLDVQSEKIDSASLVSHQFERHLQFLRKEYDRILLVSNGCPESFETQALIQHADRIVYGITDESLEAIKSLPEKTFFIIQSHLPMPSITLGQIMPKLERLLQRGKLFSFSSVQAAWRDLFPSNKI